MPYRRLLIAALAAATFALPGTALADHGGGAIAGETVVGTIEIDHSDDFAAKRSEWNYYLRTETRRLKLRLPAGAEPPRGGRRFEVKGRIVGNELLVAADGLTPAQQSLTTAGAATGARKTAVILLNFSNDPRQPYTADQVRQQIFTGAGSVNAYYQEQSFGLVSFTGKARGDGDVFGWYTISSSSSPCSYTTWASAAKSKAAAAGVDLSGYQHIVYFFPTVSSCGWAGLAYVPGSESWINGYLTTRVIAHELGHNLGVHHAGSYRCTAGGVNVAISSTCTFSEYGDPFDVMGTSQNHMSNQHKGQLGWFPASNIVTSSASATYGLLPQEALGSGYPQIIRVPRGSTGEYYYLEYRQPYGFDGFSTSDPVVNGVSIRLAKDWSSITQSKLIDARPAT